MTRYFNGKPIELLAPAGTYEIFQEVVKTNCDAIYFGGRILNMRMIRSGYNLNDDEVIKAIQLANQYDKKAYITINNLNSQSDIAEARNYLKFLAFDAKPDAIIVQDMAIIQLIKDMELPLNIHASVMMNVHNLEMVKTLEKLGVSRVVVSRDFSLETVKYFKSHVPNMEFEYFTHGDMCSVHGSQCYFSSLLFGMSSNRGRCLKPCRWWFKVKKDGFVYDPQFPLAAKDMCMYEYLPEMILSGVTSFKIEGRMREKEFIVNLINYYGDAIDRYIKEPLKFNRKKDLDKIFESRKRDLSTSYAFGNPGLNNINLRYEGTGKIYSSGKMFSKPIAEKELTEEKLTQIKNIIATYPKKELPLTLTVKVNNAEQAMLCINKKVDKIILSGNVFVPDTPWSREEINKLCEVKGETKIILGTPKIFDELDYERFSHLLSQPLLIDGISVSNLGAVDYFQSVGYEIFGDYALNIYNDLAILFYSQHGLKEATLSVELPIEDLCQTISKSPLPTEIIVHGLMSVMHLEHDLYQNTIEFKPIGNEDNLYVSNDILVLYNEAGEYPVYKDDRGRNHLHNSKEINLISLIRDLNGIGLRSIRIEGQTYNLKQLEKIIDVYKRYTYGQINLEEANNELHPNYFGFTLGSLWHEVK